MERAGEAEPWHGDDEPEEEDEGVEAAFREVTRDGESSPSLLSVRRTCAGPIEAFMPRGMSSVPSRLLLLPLPLERAELGRGAAAAGVTAVSS